MKKNTALCRNLLRAAACVLLAGILSLTVVGFTGKVFAQKYLDEIDRKSVV